MPYKDPEKARKQSRESARKWRTDHPERAYKVRRKCELKREYGLTLEEYDGMVIMQNGRCAICGRGDEQLGVDHDHSTGTVRGLLCQRCNGGIGFLQDNPDLTQKATDYLRGGNGGV